MAYVRSILHSGGQGLVVDIECQLTNGLPSIIIVGLGNKAVAEAKERVRSAFASSKLVLPKKRITINLAPADIPKDSSSFDLPIAAAILQAERQFSLSSDQALIGEIGLDGGVRPVRGIIGKLLTGRQAGITTYYIPAGNAQQAQLVPNVRIIPISRLGDLCHNQPPVYTSQSTRLMITSQPEVRLGEIVGQTTAKRALEIAAAGGHNVLLYGPPGTGKSLLAKALAGLLPPPSPQEMLEITHLHSLASQNYDALVTTRPFRNPHHNSSHTAILGGGKTAYPGEVSLSHRGVLCLDEMPEFSRVTLESLRQPLEDKCITISRNRHSVRYPAHFLLAATANPCPCGYYGTSRPCGCSPGRIIRYRQKLSGPILDRIDLHIHVGEVDHRALLTSTSAGPQDDHIQKRIAKARGWQQLRYGSAEKTNSEMTNAEVQKLAKLVPAAQSLLDTAADRLGLSARSYMKMIKIARTIADLEQHSTITVEYISEALQYRLDLPEAK